MFSCCCTGDLCNEIQGEWGTGVGNGAEGGGGWVLEFGMGQSNPSGWVLELGTGRLLLVSHKKQLHQNSITVVSLNGASLWIVGDGLQTHHTRKYGAMKKGS